MACQALQQHKYCSIAILAYNLYDTVCLLEQQQLNHLPIKAADIKRETSADPVLSKVRI